jgi:hypothetical protein
VSPKFFHRHTGPTLEPTRGGVFALHPELERDFVAEHIGREQELFGFLQPYIVNEVGERNSFFSPELFAKRFYILADMCGKYFFA